MTTFSSILFILGFLLFVRFIMFGVLDVIRSNTKAIKEMLEKMIKSEIENEK